MSAPAGTVPDLDAYLAAWHELVRGWLAARRRGGGAAEAVLDAALADGLDVAAPRARARIRPVSTEDEWRCEAALVRRSGHFDEAGYLGANPSVAAAERDPVDHFCRGGWKSPRNPSLELDVWWYQCAYLDPADDRVNPLVHYLLVGRHAGHDPLPTRPERPTPRPLAGPDGGAPRRVCLFAGWDPDGLLDDYVVDYVRELARHADVYYLADCLLEDGELAKLDGLVAGAWAVRHGNYDFGSYSMLARDLVGWDVIEGYDELLLANDSCYLLRPLDDVLTEMAARPCDWWGLQMTSRHFAGVVDRPGGPRRPMPRADVLASSLSRAVYHYDDFVHVGSYLMGLRGPVVGDEGFRKRLDRVSAQTAKINLIYRFETGTTQYLVGQGFAFSTYVEDLWPYHPVYGPGAFALIARGFPLLKRQLLSENPYDTPDLAGWKERVRELVPGADVATLERNLLRVSADDRLRRSFGIVTRPDGTVAAPPRRTPGQLRALDRRTTKHDHWWAFPVCAYDHTFASNERAVFEEVRDDPSIKKIVLTRSRPVDPEQLGGENVVVCPLESPEGQRYVFGAKQIFIKHSARANVPFPTAWRQHHFINTWHGIPLKRFGFASVEAQADPEPLARLHEMNHAVICSSRIDRLAMTAAFHPLSYPDLWVTGLPRNDFILRDTALLPADLRAQEERLRAEAGGRRIVLFLPTFKSGQAGSYYRFTADQVEWLRRWCRDNDAVVAVREHMADKGRTYSHMLAPLEPINLSSRRYPDLEVLYRAADALITDYSSCVVDFLLTGRPVISFAYDYDRYATQERGLFYDLERVLPGPVARDFDQLSAALDDLFRERTPAERADYDWKRRIFFDHVDDQSSWRVVQQVKRLYVSGA